MDNDCKEEHKMNVFKKLKILIVSKQKLISIGKNLQFLFNVKDLRKIVLSHQN